MISNQTTAHKYHISLFLHRLNLRHNQIPVSSYDFCIFWKSSHNEKSTEIQQCVDGVVKFDQEIKQQLDLQFEGNSQKYSENEIELTIMAEKDGQQHTFGKCWLDLTKLVNKPIKEDNLELELVQCSYEGKLDLTANAQRTQQQKQSLLNELNFLADSDLYEVYDLANYQGESKSSIGGQTIKQSRKRMSITDISKELNRREESNSELMNKIKELEKTLAEYLSIIDSKNKQIVDLETTISQQVSRLQCNKQNVLEKKISFVVPDYCQEEPSIQQKKKSRKQEKVSPTKSIGQLEANVDLMKSFDKNFDSDDSIIEQKDQEIQCLFDEYLQCQKLEEKFEKKKNEYEQLLAFEKIKLAQVFNASMDYGGIQLMDYLQESMGLFEHMEEVSMSQ